MIAHDVPGEGLVRTGLSDLAAKRESVPALLVSIGAPRLGRLGLQVPHVIADAEHRLYLRLHAADPDAAHSRYNALIRRLVSCERAIGMREVADARGIEAFMDALANEAREPARVYFTDGTTAVLLGWRSSTIDIDLELVPESDALLRAIPRLKELLHVNVELASPKHFIPVPPGWEDRSRFIEGIGHLTFYHFDLYSQALAKVERGHTQDLADVRAMVQRGFVVPERALELFEAIEPQLYRYPALDPATMRRAVTDVFGSRAPSEDNPA